jgi:hypothetical protein
MNKFEAQIFADRHLDAIRRVSPVEISMNYEISEEYPIGFVFFYNSKSFWETRDLSASLAGNGPILVFRDTGEVVDLPSYQSVKKSIRDISESLPG